MAENFYGENTQVIIDIRDKLNAEITAIRATGNEGAVEVAQDVYSIMDNMLGVAVIRSRGDDTDAVKMVQMLSNYVRYIQTILSGGILTPLTGREEEWETINLPENEEHVLHCIFRGKDYPIPYKSVQVNRRYGNIFRFNKDNKYAHRVDMIRFVDRDNPNRYASTPVSVRFIKFPYTLDQIICPVMINEDGTTTYLSNTDGSPIDETALLDRIAFRSSAGTVIPAPTIPFYMLKREGIDYQKEIEDFMRVEAGSPNIRVIK